MKFSLKKITKEQKDLRRRIIEVSYSLQYSHLGSCLTAVDCIDTIYKIKNKNDIFVLSNGHAGISWYAVLEKYGYIPDKNIIKELAIHPDRNTKYGIHVSTGSLGQGLPIAVGMAIADRTKTIYCMLSDGECSEGSIWESFQVIKRHKIINLKVIINANGWSAYAAIDIKQLKKQIKGFGFDVLQIDGHDMNKITNAFQRKNKDPHEVLLLSTTVAQFPFLRGQDAHYHVMNQKEYQQAMEALKQ